MAKKLEEHLYRSAQTKDEYIDQNTLKKRLQMIAHGLGVPKSGGGGGASSVGMASIGGDSSNQAASPSAAAGQNGQIAQLKAMQAQAQAASGGSTYDAQSSQAQQQLNLLKQQQQQQLGIMAAMIQQSGQDGSINKEALLQQLQQQQVSSIIRLPLQFCGIYIVCGWFRYFFVPFSDTPSALLSSNYHSPSCAYAFPRRTVRTLAAL